MSNALEWIPYDRFYNIKYIEKIGVYRANWVDGKMCEWNNYYQNWSRYKNMVVNIKSLNNSKEITIEFMNEIRKDHEIYGITQDPETKYYMMVFNNKCKKCNYICNTIHFQHEFINWTSGNDDIDKFIQDTQLSVHKDNEISHALEWIPYDRFYNIKYIEKIGVYIANWIDGKIYEWNNYNQNWHRYKNMVINIKSLNNSKGITLEFMNKIGKDHEIYGITQDPETKYYMMVFNNKCKKCNYICNAIHFQHEFIDWTSGNKDIDKFIQDTQISVHEDNEISYVLEWIPYDRFYNIKYIEKIGVYRANWIDGKIYEWNNDNQNWNRYKNMIINIKSLNNSKEITIEFINEVHYN
uniref:Uncharacterized protein n=1 Tax=Rhizophagus irregularis (strain DAOM 181602 / DAOM 197198 / MUCL 43194) TaxID=747089 RepID=U9U4T8_RHIID